MPDNTAPFWSLLWGFEFEVLELLGRALLMLLSETTCTCWHQRACIRSRGHGIHQQRQAEYQGYAVTFFCHEILGHCHYKKSNMDMP